MSKKLRIFINSNASWSTSGYGNQMAELQPLIVKEGYPLAVCDFFGLQGGKIMLDGVLHYPVINHVYGSDALHLHGKDFGADVTFTLQDIWPLAPEDLSLTNRFIPIVPVDHDPVPKIILDKLRYAYRVITYSQFGYDQLRKSGVFSTYIQHTVNTEVFTPKPKEQRKKESGLPVDSFLVGMVAANKDNPPRKSFQEVMDAFKIFLQVEPKAYLYLHTNPQFPGGFQCDQYASYLGIKDRVLFPDVYQMSFNMTKEHMANVYNTFDVLLAPSISEGFGVPIIEAQSCGIPVITNDFTAMSELVKEGETGFKTKVATLRWSGVQSYMGIPSTESIYESLKNIHKADREKMSKAARTFVVDNYDTQKIFNKKWKPYFEQLEEEVYGVAQEKTKGV